MGNSGFAIETASKEKAKLEAEIAKLTSDSEVASDKIDGLAAAIASLEKELKDSSVVRSKESADFSASEKELMDALSALSRAVGILEKAKLEAEIAKLTSDSEVASDKIDGLAAA